LATQKAKAATGPEVTKSVTIVLKDATLESVNAAAEVIGAPKDATFSLGNAPYIPSDDGTMDNTYPWQATFTWSETL